MASIKCDVALDVTPEGLQRRVPDQSKLHELLTRFEFHAWLKQLDAPDGAAPPRGLPPAKTEQHVEAVPREAQRDQWLHKLERAEVFALLLEFAFAPAGRETARLWIGVGE
jgi:DNA polymerase-1